MVSAPDDNSKGGPRQQWLDVSFVNAPVVLSYISFHNYYCAAITISHTSMRAEGDPLMQLHMKGRAPTWQVVVPKLALMAAAHHEDDAQRYHELTTSHFAHDFDHRRVTRLRICCLQPSPTWREYGLRSLRFYSIEQPIVPSLQPAPSLSPAERELAATIVDHLVDLSQVALQIRRTVAAAKSARPAVASAAARQAERELAPYVVGEFGDELRLCSIDSLAGQRSAASGSCASSAGSRIVTSGVGACGGGMLGGMLERFASAPAPRDHVPSSFACGDAPSRRRDALELEPS